jgi:hypothetical protein
MKKARSLADAAIYANDFDGASVYRHSLTLNLFPGMAYTAETTSRGDKQ